MTEKEMSPANTFEELAIWAERGVEERKKSADLAYEVAKAERDRTLLRFKIADGLIQGGASKTAAHDRARTDPEYIQASVDVDELTRRWEHVHADAVGTQNAVELALAQLADQRGRDHAKVALKSIQAFITRHVRTLSLSDDELEGGE